MENKQPPSQKKSLSTIDEKLIRKIDYDSCPKISRSSSRSELYLDVEIVHNNSHDHEKPSQKVLVSIKPRAPGIKTLYLAEKNRFNTKKRSHKTGSRLAIGDHVSFPTDGSKHCTLVNSTTHEDTKSDVLNDKQVQGSLTENKKSDDSTFVSKCSQPITSRGNCKLYSRKNRTSEKCYVYEQPHLIMNLRKFTEAAENQLKTKKFNKATLTTNNSSSDETLVSSRIVKKLLKKINNLERKLLLQEMVFRSLENNIATSSSDEESKGNIRTSVTGHPGCSYIEQYSHIPETSAFQRYAQQSTSVSASKATNVVKDHNSEQYGRDFTTYDGLTARGRRQSSSVPGKRDDIPKMAAERVHKIRHKLNPVRDYRLMDTVHYLAQGEFAPRDDGIKLTPSREAVLSDIIWEDVCRTHWPNARLARRQYDRNPERYGSRFELQRLIDNLLRERVAHVERRRRRHYRIVKLNHRHESCRPVGKTGDIIVASHKSKQSNDDREVPAINKSAASAVLPNHKHEDHSPRRGHRSHDRLTYPWSRKKKYRQDDCSPGPSSAVCQNSSTKDPTYCYQASNGIKINSAHTTTKIEQEQTSGVNLSNKNLRTPRLVVKKDSLRRKYSSSHKQNLDHYILLPTLVVRTPSNVKRQKKFNELYQRVLNGHINNEQNTSPVSETNRNCCDLNSSKRDIGLNIKLNISNSEEKFNKN